MLEHPNYQDPEFGVPAIPRTLANFGKITISMPSDKDGFVRV